MMVMDLFFSSRSRHTRLQGDWSSDVCSSDLHLRWQDTRHAHGDGADAKVGRPCPPELRAQAVACDLRALCDAHAAPVGAHEDAVAGDDSLECAVVEVNEHVLSAHEHLVLADDDAFDSGGVTAPHDRAIPDTREEDRKSVV